MRISWFGECGLKACLEFPMILYSFCWSVCKFSKTRVPIRWAELSPDLVTPGHQIGFPKWGKSLHKSLVCWDGYHVTLPKSLVCWDSYHVTLHKSLVDWDSYHVTLHKSLMCWDGYHMTLHKSLLYWTVTMWPVAWSWQWASLWKFLNAGRCRIEARLGSITKHWRTRAGTAQVAEHGSRSCGEGWPLVREWLEHSEGCWECGWWVSLHVAWQTFGSCLLKGSRRFFLFTLPQTLLAEIVLKNFFQIVKGS